jgi:hypothetical protein
VDPMLVTIYHMQQNLSVTPDFDKCITIFRAALHPM